MYEVLFLYSAMRARGSAPYISVSNSDLDQILENLQLSAGSHLVDLGSGDGRVLKYALVKHPDICVTGYEIGLLPRMKSKLSLRQFRNRTIHKNQSFFNANISDATHIYTYLLPEVMKKLEAQLNAQLKPGTRLVSCDFELAEKVPDKIIDISGPGKITKRLIVYTW